MSINQQLLFGFAAALGSGLLIGIERERRKGFGAKRGFAGVRTFALGALAGATAGFLRQPLLTFSGALLVLSLAAIGRWRKRSNDPGITTELALFVTYLLGVIAMDSPALAAAGAVIVAALLIARRALHAFSVEVLSETELRDGLLFGACALIVLPILPSAPMPWLAGGSAQLIFALVVMFMGLQSAGYVALRIAGPRLGLSLSGLVAGFISSTATVAALGARTRSDPRLHGACVSGALFSSVATVLLLAIVVGTVYMPALAVVGPSLLAALITALIAATLSLRLQRGTSPLDVAIGRPFNLVHALGFAAMLGGVTAVMGLINARYGHTAASLAAAIAGFFDVHAAATSTLSLAARGAITPSAVLVPILIAFSTNTASKLVAAFFAGGVRYGLSVAAGLISIAVAAWAPMAWNSE